MNELNETGTSKKQIFISYSHEDREFAGRLASTLHNAGEEVWWDRWEILVGDSLIQKIFEEGLAQAAAFVVVLSSESVKSKWVRQELDVATVRKIEGVTKIIPVVIDKVEIPSALRALLWIDMRRSFEEGVQRIIHSVHGIRDKPKRSAQESIALSLTKSVAGLSLGASTVGLFVLRSAAGLDSGDVPAFSGQDLSSALNLDPQAINDAVDELEEAGMVRILRAFGTAPYEFYQFQPTYVLYGEFSEYLDYNPEEDIRITAAAVASAKQIESQQLAERTGLSPGRLNRAVEYLADYGLVDKIQSMGTYPFSFLALIATRRTRQFVSE